MLDKVVTLFQKVLRAERHVGIGPLSVFENLLANSFALGDPPPRLEEIRRRIREGKPVSPREAFFSPGLPVQKRAVRYIGWPDKKEEAITLFPAPKIRECLSPLPPSPLKRPTVTKKFVHVTSRPLAGDDYVACLFAPFPQVSAEGKSETTSDISKEMKGAENPK